MTTVHARCSKCLGLAEVAAAALPTLEVLRAEQSTIYASDALAFPGRRIRGAAQCPRCGARVIAIAVEEEVAQMLESYPRC